MIILNKLFDLKGRTALITGASGHLAEKISLILADLNCNLILVSRKNKFTNNYDKKIINRYPNIKITKIICDLSKEQKRKILISKLKNKKINILINNATFNENNLVGYASTFEKQSIKK